LPLGKEDHLRGQLDVINKKAIIYSENDQLGSTYEVTDVPAESKEAVEKAYADLVEQISNIDDELAEETLKRIYVDPKRPSYVPEQSVMERREKAYEATVKQNQGFRENVLEVWNGKGTGMDSEIMQGTVWGLYNAVVEWEDYRPTSQDDSRSYNVLWGDRSLRKEAAYAELFQFATENNS